MTSTRSTIGLTATAICVALAFSTLTARADQGFADPPAEHEAHRLSAQPPVAEPPGKHPPADHSGRKQSGKASYYGHEFAGQKMANGRPFNPKGNTAASKSLPLGTVAKVTNPKNGKSTMVHIEDRGPYVNGRVVDLTTQSAAELDIKHDGVAPVVVSPVAVPQPNGEVKPGAGAAEVPAPAAAQALRDVRDRAPRTKTDPVR